MTESSHHEQPCHVAVSFLDSKVNLSGLLAAYWEHINIPYFESQAGRAFNNTSTPSSAGSPMECGEGALAAQNSICDQQEVMQGKKGP